MLRALNDLRGYKVIGTDGGCGEVDDFCFEDSTWSVKYVVVDTGGALIGRRVLVSPSSIQTVNKAEMTLNFSLTKTQIENSPGAELRRPFGQPYTTSPAEYFAWPNYWDGPNLTEWNPFAMPIRAPAASSAGPAVAEETEPSLRSIRDVIGYHILATDGRIGHVDEFIASDQNWVIHYLAARTRNWLPGRCVVVAREWVTQIDWARRLLSVDLTKETISQAPEYDPSALGHEEYEKALAESCGRMICGV